MTEQRTIRVFGDGQGVERLCAEDRAVRVLVLVLEVAVGLEGEAPVSKAMEALTRRALEIARWGGKTASAIIQDWDGGEVLRAFEVEDKAEFQAAFDDAFDLLRELRFPGPGRSATLRWEPAS